MKSTTLACATTLFTLVFSAPDSIAAPRPNILYFYVDDMGYGSIGPNGQNDRRANNLPAVQTPNIDAMAVTGVNFQRAYGAPVCSPARSSQQTGYHQGHTYADRNDTNNARKAMRAEDITMGDALKAAGYVTGYWGKWGYGAESKQNDPALLNLQTLPNNHGYDYILTELHHTRAHTFFQPTLWHFKPGDTQIALIPNSMAAYTDPASYPQSPAKQSDPAYPSTAYCDDLYAMHCLDFVRTQAQNYNSTGQPFFALFAPQIPHSPYGEVSSLPGYADAYASDPHFADRSAQAQNWAAMVTRIDAHIGNILAALEDPNNDGDTSDSVAANTLVIFQSDNGGASNDGVSQYASNADLRGAKNSIWEGGLRVPLVMRWPDEIDAHSPIQIGTNSQRVVDVTDLLPTFCELAGVEIPTGVDGVSIAPTLTGDGHQRARPYITHESQPNRSIIRGNMKLVDKNGSFELYDLDVNENTNIASSHTGLVSELSTLLLGENVRAAQWTANTYHNWTGADNTNISDAANWSDYIYAEGGTTYNTENGAPTIPWTASMKNSGGSHNTSTVDRDTSFLSLEVEGASATAKQMIDVSDKTLTARNELRLKAHSSVDIDNGTLDTLRWVEVHEEAAITGSGDITGTLYQSGSLVISQSSPTSIGVGGETLTDRIVNGGFETGSGTSFSATDQWSNATGDDTKNARNTTNPQADANRGIVSGLVSPTQNTTYIIQDGDQFRFSFYYAAASAWDIGNDTITVTIFYNDGSEQILFTDVFTPSQDFGTGYDFSGAIDFAANPGSVGQNLQIRFDSATAGNSEFAAIDSISLVTVERGNIELLTNGDFENGTGESFTATDSWTSTEGNDSDNVRNTSSPQNGSYRGIVTGNRSPQTDTGHVIQSGNNFTLSFHHAAALSWDIGSDTLDAVVFYDNGSEVELSRTTVNPSQKFDTGYDFSGEINIAATADSIGHALRLRFESTNAGNSEFAAIDNISLSLAGGTIEVPGKRVISIDGEYRLEDSASVGLELAGTSTAGIDYSQIQVTGNATLAGTLNLTIDPAYTPSNGDTFTILTAASVSGTFANPGDIVVASDGTRFQIGYTATSITLRAVIPSVTRETGVPPNAMISNPDDNTGAGSAAVANGNTKGQAFNVTRGGPLTGLLLHINTISTGGDITINIYHADGSGLPSGAPVHSETGLLPAGLSAGDYLQFIFSSAARLTPGNYVFTISTSDADFSLEITQGNNYSGGTLVRNQGSGWESPNSNNDLDFALLGRFNTKGVHIVHILVDDLGYTDHSVDSLVLNSPTELSDFIETPNLEKLASEGVSFTWSYTQPNCAPSRAAYMTGQYSCRVGNGVYNVDSLKRSGNRTTYLSAPNQGENDGDEAGNNDDFIRPQTLNSEATGSVPLAQAMKNAGYVTCHIGKYHVGSSNSTDSTYPLNQGLDFNYGGGHKGNPGNYFASGTPRQWGSNVGPELDAFASDYTQAYIDANIKPFENGNDSDSLLGTPKHLTDAVVDAFEDFMNSHQAGSTASSPVYVQFHFYATHSPLNGRPDLVAKYTAKKAAGATPVNDTKESFAALAENMDQSVARVMRYLSDPNGDGDTSDSIAENTLIVWTTDNGGSESYSENAPLRGAKGQHFEGGIRVPMIIRQPGTVPAGKISDTLIHTVDLYPTFIDVAAESPNSPNPNAATHPLDGESLYAHMLDPEHVARDRGPIFYHFPGYMDTRAYPVSVVIKEVEGDRYKYIYNYDPYYASVQDVSGSPDEFQLYNLSIDPYESVNLMDYIDRENAGDLNDPLDSREYWDYLLHKGTADQLASDLNTWLNQTDPTWQPIFATYKQEFADNSPIIGDADVGNTTPPAPVSTPAKDSVPAPADFSFTTETPTNLGNNNLQFTFDSHDGFAYQVQASNSLESDSWVNIGSTVTASGDSTEFTVNDPAAATAPRRFYRVILVK
ncbi:sulfatase-like hydrolase/transferase [Verrucomicrobiaceae bacterium N1E253]|uniref:Sulfatase-like hydrolase/transferase n=1 Tax=Oceaniferula marina TaxID=2748318 RepID=A0A851GMI5_9BACT|nr:sulfatase-like hydrolase/transferase [Oceaniferula marina]NWK56257.1 sulfatase-like hydrolase/transferase [Oceaniferula marina]